MVEMIVIQDIIIDVITLKTIIKNDDSIWQM